MSLQNMPQQVTPHEREGGHPDGHEEDDCGGCEKKSVPLSNNQESLIEGGFYRALEVCFGELKKEPKTMLIIGGCRQLAMAKKLAFAFPFTDITLLDPDEAQVTKAQEEICCRFKFVQGTLEALPFEDNAFDVTIAHHLFEYVKDWPLAMAHIGRTTNNKFIYSTFRPNVAKAMNMLPGVNIEETLQKMGLTRLDKPVNDPGNNMFLTHLTRYGKLKVMLEPPPWKLNQVNMRPIREERTVLPL
ncbi:MAG: class I SAM-dependent methyltransferase [Vampirovibrio sp.]|nr:class I SAM-dependent methyltransferase [Vampirovibrio sp.]